MVLRLGQVGNEAVSEWINLVSKGALGSTCFIANSAWCAHAHAAVLFGYLHLLFFGDISWNCHVLNL